MENKNEFQLVLQGQKHDIDARVLSETINNIEDLISELNSELSPDYKIQLRIQTFKEGSFEILFGLFADPTIRQTIFNILSVDNIKIVGNIISTLADIISIKKFLFGDKPKSVEKIGDNQVKIENNKGEVMIVNQKTGDMIFNNPVINVTINNTFQTISSETDVTGLKFKSQSNTKEVEIPKEEFEMVIKSNPMLTSTVKESTIEPSRVYPKENVSLSIFKIVFDEKYKWQFLDNEGQKISATIRDTDFFERVRKGELNFRNGDVLIANMEIIQEYNEIARAYENKAYSLVEIKDIKHQAIQSRLDI